MLWVLSGFSLGCSFSPQVGVILSVYTVIISVSGASYIFGSLDPQVTEIDCLHSHMHTLESYSIPVELRPVQITHTEDTVLLCSCAVYIFVSQMPHIHT